MWLVQRSPSNVDNWVTLSRCKDEQTAKGSLARSLVAYCTGKFRVLAPDGRVVDLKYARELFTVA